MRRRRGGRSGVCGAVRAPGVRGTEAEMPIELRPVGQLSAREFARNAAPLQYQHAIRERGDEVEVLLHQQDRQPSGFPEPGEDLRHVFDDRGLDTLGGLVEQEKHGVPHQASRQGQKLLLAAREHLARSVEERFEPGEVDQQRRERGPLVAVAVVPPREVEVLPHRQPRKDPPGPEARIRCRAARVRSAAGG